MNRVKNALSLSLFEELKLIPLRGFTKIPSIKKWNSYQTIPFLKLKPLLKDNNYGVVCGKVSQGVWVIDCDSLQATQKIERLLEKYQLKTYQVNTKRGRHFYFKSPLFLYSTKSQDIDIKGNNSYVVGAGSLNDSFTYSAHNNEKILTVYPQGKDQDFFRDLEDIIEKKIKLRPYLSPQLKQRLLNLSQEQSTSEQEFNIILEMVSKGYSKQEILKLLELKLHKSSHFYKNAEQQKYFDLSYKKAYKVHQQQLSKEKDDRNHFSQYIGSQDIKATAKKILWYFYQQSEGKSTVKASYRQIMKKACIGSLKTVQKHIQWLSTLGYIKPVQTSVYELQFEKIIKKDTIPNTFVSRTLSLDIDPLLRKKTIHPLFSHGYLGTNVFFALQAILNRFLFHSFNFKDLFSFLSVPSSSLYRSLKTMVSLKIIEKKSKFYTLSKDFVSILDQYNRFYGIEKKHHLKVQKLKQQQDDYKLYQTLFRSYKKGHIPDPVWKKLQFTMILFSIDSDLILQLLQEDFALKQAL